MEFVSQIRDNRRVKTVLASLLLVTGLLASGERAAWAQPSAAEDEQAKKLFVEGNHLEAALAYEDLWNLKKEARFLFNAAMARELSGHELQAFVHLQHYLRLSELSNDERKEAQDRLRALKQRTKQARLIISPATLDAGALTLKLQRAPDGSTSDRGRLPVALDGETMKSIGAPGYAGAFDLYLEPGRWDAEAVADGYRTQTVAITIDSAKHKAEVVLRLLPAAPHRATVPVSASFGPPLAVSAGIDVSLVGPTPNHERVDTATKMWSLEPGDYTLEAKAPHFRRRQVTFKAHNGAGPLHIRLVPERRYETIVLGAAAGATLVTGAVLSSVYGGQLKSTLAEFTSEAEDGDANAAASHRPDIARTRSNRIIGMRFLGAGLGLGIGALTSALEYRVKRPERIYVGEAIAGAGLAAIALGLTWALPRRDFGDSLDAHYCATSKIQLGDSDYCTSERTMRLNLTDPADPLISLRHIDVGSLFGGLGVGLFSASVASLVKLAVYRRAARRNVTVSSLRGYLQLNF